MAVVTLQLGQCGNQLGEELFESLYGETTRAREALSLAIRRTYFADNCGEPGAQWRPRAVLVDTEPRVVQRCLGRPNSEAWGYDSAAAVWRQAGAANNWACGYRTYGPEMEGEVLERVRREVQGCDRLEGFLALHSVAGGTGSGLGSYILQALRDEFPKESLGTLSVWPFEGGEVSVQSYNAALSLASLYQSADLVLLQENERQLDLCRKALQERCPSLQSINAAMAEATLHALVPCRLGSDLGCPLLRLRGQLCAHPLYRLLTMRALPQVSHGARAFDSDSWQALQRRMVQLCGEGSVVDKPGGGPEGCPRPCRSVAAAALLWGLGALEADVEGLKQLPFWRFALEPLQVHADPQKVASLDRSLGLVSNCQTVVPMLARAAARAPAMLRASAYLHQYEQHGLDREEMSEAVLTLLQIQNDYEQLS